MMLHGSLVVDGAAATRCRRLRPASRIVPRATPPVSDIDSSVRLPPAVTRNSRISGAADVAADRDAAGVAANRDRRSNDSADGPNAVSPITDKIDDTRQSDVELDDIVALRVISIVNRLPQACRARCRGRSPPRRPDW